MSDLYVYTGDGSCRSCDAPLLWFRTPAGKNMPIDDSDALNLLPGTLTVGETFTRAEGKEMLLPYAHWASCPNASQHRRGS